MLILSRRPNESLHIGTDVVITVLGIRGNQVRLGITAPKNIAIDRAEVHQRKLAEYRAAPVPPVQDHPVAPHASPNIAASS
jgi:carbon storage regulator